MSIPDLSPIYKSPLCHNLKGGYRDQKYCSVFFQLCHLKYTLIFSSASGIIELWKALNAKTNKATGTYYIFHQYYLLLSLFIFQTAWVTSA